MAVDGDGEDHHAGHGLIKLALGTEVDPSMAIRVFNTLESYQGSPDDDWGMKINWPSWIDKVHNSRSGRCFMFGTGPSLIDQMPLLGRMKTETTWTVNRMRLWKDLPFTPTHHIVAEPGPINGWGTSIFHRYDYEAAMNRIAISWWPVTAKGWLWCPKAPDDIQMRWQGMQGFGDRLAPVTTGWSSPLTSVQVAAWMGYRELYFLGIDTTQEGQAWDREQGRTAEPRNIRSILECFERANRDIKRNGGVVYDCTPGGRINREGALEYADLGEVLAGAVP
jgi:hypothetical protein